MIMQVEKTDSYSMVKRILPYLTKYGWGPVDIGIALMKFEETHGKDAVGAMARFITWAEENQQRDIIGSTLGHDLNGCEDKLMCPRTSSY